MFVAKPIICKQYAYRGYKGHETFLPQVAYDLVRVGIAG